MEQEFKEHDLINPAEAVVFAGELADSVAEINEAQIESAVEVLTNVDNYDLKNPFSVKDVLERKLYDMFLERINSNNMETQYADMFHDMFSEYFDNVLIQTATSIDKDIVISDYSKRTTEWLASWSHDLAEILNTNNYNAVVKILDKCLDNNSTIEETADLIADLGVRAEGYSARRLAITETYRINNYAEMESMLQNPAVIGKMWDHAGTPKNPRPNHLAMHGITIKVNETFTLRGIKGGVYEVMAPHDTILPAEECIHCGCRVKAKTADEILNKSKKEKEKLQQKRLKAADTEWEKEFNAKNKAASGIDFERVKLDWVKKKSPEDQIKYFGGGHSGKARKALIDAGVVNTDEQLNTLYKRNSAGKRQLKTLKELEDSGIMTIRKSTLDHTTKGAFTNLKNPSKPPGGNNGGKPEKGFHAESSFKLLEDKGFKCQVNETLPNGVRIGTIQEHKTRIKREDNGQVWFPKDWTDDDILVAATAIINNPKNKMGENDYLGLYKCHDENVLIQIYTNKPGSIYPDIDNQPKE